MRIIAARDFDPSTMPGDIVVMFSTSRCGPCRMLQPVMDGLAAEALGVSVAKVLLDEDAEALASKFGIVTVPTLVLFRDGKQVGHPLIGFRGKKDVKSWIVEAHRENR